MVEKVASSLPAAGRLVASIKKHPPRRAGRRNTIWSLSLDQPQLGALFIFPLTSTAWLMLITEFKAPPNVLIMFAYSVALMLPVLVIPHTLIVMSEELP